MSMIRIASYSGGSATRVAANASTSIVGSAVSDIVHAAAFATSAARSGAPGVAFGIASEVLDAYSAREEEVEHE